MKKLIVLLAILLTTNAYANIRSFGSLPEAIPTTNGEAIYQQLDQAQTEIEDADKAIEVLKKTLKRL